MTDHTPAAQAAKQEPVLTDADILHHWDAYVGEPSAALPLSDADKIAFARAIESALLSKLRAPVADERAAFEHAERASNLERDEEDDYMNPCVQSSWEGWQARAALESAPVAGEAQLSEYRRGVMDAFHLANMANANRQGRTAEETCAHLVRSLADLANGDAAPQASEAVRVQCCGNIVELAEAIVKAHDSMFAQCCSNPVRNAWGAEVNMFALNHAYVLARAALSAQPGAQKERGQ